ncbi:MAG TPA: hypothetical protein HPP77_09535 [Candidatus Hydrogenedentes bacterium]|nr:hypothetical protein [Candidatus Hydrogenedentota bacterium]
MNRGEALSKPLCTQLWNRDVSNPLTRTPVGSGLDSPPEAEEQNVVTKHGKPAGVHTGFATDDDWFDFQLENDPRFLKKIEESRASVRAGQGIPWTRVKQENDERTKP